MKDNIRIGVAGAGNMGSGIAQKLAQEGLNVVMLDLSEEIIAGALRNIRKMLEQGIKRGILTPEKVEAILSRIERTTDITALADTEIVIEAVFEEQDVKKQLFEELDRICSPRTILATNTSSFYVSEMANATKRPDRFIGMHYFFHPAKNRLLEIIPHEGCSDETVQRTLEVARLHGKTTIVVKDAPGFVVNRFFVPFLTESAKILQENMADIPTIEEAAKQAFKIGMGPFQLMNITGIPITVHASATFGRELGPFYDTPEIITAQVAKDEPWDLAGTPDESKFEMIQGRLYGASLGAAAALVSEGVASIEDTDRGAKVGLRWRQGPFEIMNRIGISKSFQLIKAIADNNPDFTLPDCITKQMELGRPFTFNFIDQDIRDNIAYITINRPEAMNALNPVVVNQLDQAFSDAEKNPEVAAIVFQGAGKAFVAGADISFFVKSIRSEKIDDIISFSKQGHDLLARIENAQKKTIAVLDGLSLGGGSELALACQAIVATPAGSMGFPETGIGIYPGLGGMFRLARQLGPALAKYYIFTGKPLSSQQALDLGIVTKLVSMREIPQAIQEICDAPAPDKYRPRDIPASFQESVTICGGTNIDALLSGGEISDVSPKFAEATRKAVSYKAPLAVQKANELIDAQVEKTIPEAINLELESMNTIFATKDALTGLTSAGKRPQFSGA